MKLNSMILADFYKLSHRAQYPEGTEMVYSTWTARTSRMKNVNNVVVFGIQAFIKNYLIEYFNENFFSKPKAQIVEDYKRIIKFTLGSEPDTKHIEDLHDLGYLPLKIKAVAEGTRVPLRVPMMTIENTDDRFFWVTNYIESLASCELWQPSTSATIANEYKMILSQYAMETVGNVDFVPFQGHDFSMRGMSSLQSAMSSGAGHLTSFVGTDTIPAISYVEQFYNGNVEKELIGTSIPATEHSVQCAYGNDEVYINNMITKVVPKGFVSIVSDGYDFWNVIGNILPSLKNTIMARDGKVVIRPDSGDPVHIVCGNPNGDTELERKGSVEALWDIFGGTTTPQGFRVLDSHIGLIYGDAITLERCEEICKQLKAKGFSSINCVYGIGSYTYQFNTRDTFGFALKSTLCRINGDEKLIFKDPKTDNGVKKSQKGAVIVLEQNGDIFFNDNLTYKQAESYQSNLLKTVFENGKLLIDQKFSDIRKKLND